MRRPEEDLADRRPVWDAMHVLFLDTDVEALHLASSAIACARSKYAIGELERIFWGEVCPAMRVNIWSVAGEWAPLDRDRLAELILARHRFGRPAPFRRWRVYPRRMWAKLAAAVTEARRAP
ncbi:MAG: hypothetical protein MI723_12065 [Caulobacterales bacterium]|nr:hypothetical protein [Caulobacterales bacterium]